MKIRPFFTMIISAVLILSIMGSVRAMPPRQTDADVITPDNVHEVVELTEFGRGIIQAIEVSPDNRVLAVTTANGLWLFDLETGEFLHHLDWDPDYLWYIEFTPDSQYIISHGGTSILMWSIETGELIRQFDEEHVDRIGDIAISEDGQYLFSIGFDGTVKYWDVATGSLLLDGNSDTFGLDRYIVFTDILFVENDAEILIKAFDSAVVRVDIRRGELQQLESEQLPDNFFVACSPDCETLLVAGFDSTGWWHLEDDIFEPLLTDEEIEAVGAAWHPDLPLAALGGADGTVMLLNTETKEIDKTFEGHESFVYAVTFSVDGHYLISGGIDGKIIVWDIANGTQKYELSQFDYTDFVLFSSDSSKVLIAAGNGDFWVNDILSGEQIQAFKGHGSRMLGASFSADDRSILTFNRDDSVRLWDMETGEEVSNYGNLGNDVLDVRLEPDPAILIQSVSGYLEYRNIATGGVIQAFNVDAYVVTAQFSLDGGFVTSISDNNHIQLWNVEDGEEYFGTQAGGQYFSVTVSPDGSMLLATGDEGKITIVDTQSRVVLYEIEVYAGVVESSSWSPDGTTFATADDRGIVRVWGLPTE